MGMTQKRSKRPITRQTEGYNDYLNGYGITECPYERGSDEGALWLEGWEAAKAEEDEENDDE